MASTAGYLPGTGILLVSAVDGAAPGQLNAVLGAALTPFADDPRRPARQRGVVLAGQRHRERGYLHHLPGSDRRCRRARPDPMGDGAGGRQRCRASRNRDRVGSASASGAPASGGTASAAATVRPPRARRGDARSSAAAAPSAAGGSAAVTTASAVVASVPAASVPPQQCLVARSRRGRWAVLRRLQRGHQDVDAAHRHLEDRRRHLPADRQLRLRLHQPAYRRRRRRPTRSASR